MNSEIKVSVCVVTYNQEKYIAQCLQSLIEQVADFEFEIIVGNDCSTDATRSVVEGFQSAYPFLIFPLHQSENIGAVENCIQSYRRAKGKYLCHIDGDDYALPGKLQKQVDYLERNPNCVICSHDMIVVNGEGSEIRSSFRRHRAGVNTLKDLYSQLPFFAHSSKMFVNDLDDPFWLELHPNALDVELHVEQAKKGEVYHIDECLGAYRSFTGVSSQTVGVNPILVEGVTRIFEEALQNPDLDQDVIRRDYAASMYRYAYQAAVKGDVIGLRKYIKLSIDLSFLTVGQKVFSMLSNFPKSVVFLCQLRARLRGYDAF